MIVASVFLAIPCVAEPFYLKHDATGKLYGPYGFRQGAKVVIGTTSFTLVRKAAAQPTLEEKLKLTVIPEMDFRAATVEDVVEFLKSASTEHSPAEDPAQKGVNIILNLRGDTRAMQPCITFSARQLSLYEAIKVVTQIADLRFTIQGNVLMIEPKPLAKPSR